MPVPSSFCTSNKPKHIFYLGNKTATKDCRPPMFHHLTTSKCIILINSTDQKAVTINSSRGKASHVYMPSIVGLNPQLIATGLHLQGLNLRGCWPFSRPLPTLEILPPAVAFELHKHKKNPFQKNKAKRISYNCLSERQQHRIFKTSAIAIIFKGLSSSHSYIQNGWTCYIKT